MNIRTLANKYRPKQFTEVVGQESEVAVLRRILTGTWRPPAMLFAGPFGTGKTSLARLTATALLCENRNGVEPCGNCDSCRSMEEDRNTGYTELDAATRRSVADVREIKDMLQYSTTGSIRIVTFDESHMLTGEAQNSMLHILEEGKPGVVMMFATTETKKMLSTITSRCVQFDLKLLDARKIGDRLRYIANKEEKVVEDKAIRIISTYVRGHLRDAVMLLEQLMKMSEIVSEDLVRIYLRLDSYVDAYEFLVMKDKKQQFLKLEELLCKYAAGELQEIIGQSLLNAYKVKLGIGDFTQVDEAWLRKIAEAHGDTLLKKAEQVMSLEADFATINHATAVLAKIFVDETVTEIASSRDDRSSLIQGFRKPQKESVA